MAMQTPLRRFYLTTPIYYASDVPHLGHAYTTIVGDTLARYQRIRNGRDRVFYLTGMDEHGEKIERAAQAHQLAPQAFVDQIAKSYTDLWKTLHIDYDDFIRTTEPRHENVVKDLWNRLWEKGDIYQGKYEGWYCVACESFYPEKDLLPENMCPYHKKTVERVQEMGYFFRLSKYEKPLLSFYDAHPNFVEPSIRFNEVRSFVEGGLKDLSISRSSFKWGIPVPQDPSHVIYVWIDALANYWSALQSPADRRVFWGTQEEPGAIHLVGKEISRFHAVYWPAMLMAAGLPLPQKIVAHGWWTVEGEKMGKTLGNVVDPQQVSRDLGADALRYFVLREIPLGQDGDFSYDALLNRYHSELGNDLGNLLNRTLSMTEKFMEGMVSSQTDIPSGVSDPNRIEERALAVVAQVEHALEEMQPAAALTALFDLVRTTNAYLEQQAPFRLAKTNLPAAKYVLYQALESLRWLGMMLAPFMPERAEELRRQLGLKDPETVAWPRKWGAFPSETRIQKAEALFPRLDPDRQAALLAHWRSGRVNAAASKEPTGDTKTETPTKEWLSIADFQRMDLRVAQITHAEKIPQKDKLLKLTVDLGTEQRTVVAGIGSLYTPEQLQGRSVVLLANLKPAKIGGIVSQGMLLAVGDEAVVGLLQPDQAVPPGTTVR